MSQATMILEPAATGIADGLIGRVPTEMPIEFEYPSRNDLIWYDALGDTLE